MASTLTAFFVALFLSHASCLALNSEGYASLSVRRKLINPDNVLENWNQSSETPCTWNRVWCIKGRVFELNIANRNISGTLAPELGELKYLKFLELYRNHIGGRIPPEIGNLRSLVSLELQENKLEGEIPRSLGNLKSLQYLMLNNNTLTEIVPKEIFKLKHLKRLDVSGNYIAGPGIII